MTPNHPTGFNPHLKRVMLIFPPSTTCARFEPMVSTPMGIAYLAATLREAGYEVACLDALCEAPRQETLVSEDIFRLGLSYDQIIARIREFQPEVVGISCIFSNQWPAARELSRRIKAQDPDLVVCTGGAHPSFLSERCMNDAPLDFIVKGEAEESFPELLGRLRKERPFDDIDGLVWRDGGSLRQNPKTRFIRDLDRLPFPAHDLLNPESYFRVGLPMGYDFVSPRNLPVMTSRGCPCSCTFCSSANLWGRHYRTRSSANVLAELDWLQDRFQVKEIKFQDDNLTVDRKRARELFNGMADRGRHLMWNTPNGIAVWTLDEEMLGLMKRSGCFGITMAIESGDQEVLSSLIRKPLKLDKVREVNRAARRLGIFRGAYFIIGFPGETREQIGKTISFTRELKLDNCIIFIFNPLPGSELFKECLARGYITEESFFETGNQYFSSVIDSEQWKAEELERMIQREYVRNYLALFRNPVVVGRRYYNYIRHHPAALVYASTRVLRTLKEQVLKRSGRALPSRGG
ncbi:MAG TPA: cobalamin-dependent protein [bacterium]|nr:cobalamin-dependent protein [bacterium]